MITATKMGIGLAQSFQASESLTGLSLLLARPGFPRARRLPIQTQQGQRGRVLAPRRSNGRLETCDDFFYENLFAHGKGLEPIVRTGF